MQPIVVLGFLITVMNAGAMFSMYTYISPALQEFAGVTPATVATLLGMVGVGFLLGNYAGGKLADLSIHKTLIGFLVLEIACMALFPTIARSMTGAVIGLFVWAIASSMCRPWRATGSGRGVRYTRPPKLPCACFRTACVRKSKRMVCGQR